MKQRQKFKCKRNTYLKILNNLVQIAVINIRLFKSLGSTGLRLLGLFGNCLSCGLLFYQSSIRRLEISHLLTNTKQLFILFCPRIFPTLALIRKQFCKSTNLFKTSSCSPLLSLLILLKSSLLPFKLLRTLPSSSNQRLSLGPQASIFLLLASQNLVVFYNGIRHYGTPNKQGGELVYPVFTR
ncbi:hypothetical protein HanRHA438_Chr05g0208871 [Helianthus annuus]|nr:hypothetical protein HanRHA438_Chr05g0208871 [Helianthus annuus]